MLVSCYQPVFKLSLTLIVNIFISPLFRLFTTLTTNAKYLCENSFFAFSTQHGNTENCCYCFLRQVAQQWVKCRPGLVLAAQKIKLPFNNEFSTMRPHFFRPFQRAIRRSLWPAPAALCLTLPGAHK